MKNTERLTLDCFNPICILGKGSYAHVVLVNPKTLEEEFSMDNLFALKILDKADVQIRGIQSSIYLEKEILQTLNESPFTTSLFASFQDDEEICFLLEYCPGGDLFELLARKKLFDEDDTRFYMAQLILGLEAIHNKNIIYRDLKPENILIDSAGNIKIADFGRATTTKRFGDKIEGISGTPEYMAPEMTQKLKYDYRVDIWSLGCILYEMILGNSPFIHKNQKKLFELIQKRGFSMPNNINSELQDLLQQLLQKNPDKRISLKRIKKHKWFSHFDWKKAEEFKYNTPWKPNINIDQGICNFNQKFVNMSLDLITCGLGNGNYFDGFYFESEPIQNCVFERDGENSDDEQYYEREDEDWGEMNDFDEQEFLDDSYDIDQDEEDSLDEWSLGM